MIPYQTQLLLDDAVTRKVQSKDMFTAQEIVDFVKTDHTLAEPYEDLREYVHSLYYAGRMGIGYKRHGITFDDGKGSMVSAYVYHPVFKNPDDYVSHRIRVPSPSIAATAQLPTFGIHLTGLPSVMYSVDECGQIVIGRHFTTQLRLNGPSLFAISERKRVTILPEDDADFATEELTLDSDLNVRIPQSLLVDSRIKGNRLKIEVADDAIYVTEER